MSDQCVVEDIDDGYYEYFEEEVLSQYDGLSTIFGGDNESCSTRESDNPSRRHGPLRSFSEESSPHQVQMSPALHGSRGSTDSVPKSLALLSPSMFSPMSDARKFHHTKSPMLGLRPKSGYSPSTRTSQVVANLPVIFTNLETGEEILVEDNDDEFTFVSCSDTESIFNSTESIFESSLTSLDGMESTGLHHKALPTGTASLSRDIPEKEEKQDVDTMPLNLPLVDLSIDERPKDSIESETKAKEGSDG